GYKLSPLLWKKVQSGLSAGRVQSVALRLVVEKEREVLAFKPEEYWSIEAELSHQPSAISHQTNQKSLTADSEAILKAESFIASVIEQNGKKLAVKNKDQAGEHVKNLEKASYQINKITQKEVKKYPSPPFTTSTLQQVAANHLGLTSRKTMMVAQYLYEHGLITYMRTDSVNLAPQAIVSTRSYIEQNIGKAYLPPSAKVYKTKSKVAQEAHEAIRPTNISLLADKLKNMEGVTRDHVRLYDLIWKRMVASQMTEAVMEQTTVDIKASDYLLRSTGTVTKFDGWLKIYGKNLEDDEEEDKSLPKLSEGEILKLLKLLPNQHFTEAPARFTEASLIKKLEELGIGRPSTYAPTLSTIQDRYYVERKERKFFPTPLGLGVNDFLIKYFPDVFDYDFTAEMEDALDEVARGEREWQNIMKEFYGPFEKKVVSVEESAEKVKIEVEDVDKNCPDCGKKLVVKYGRFGKFLACSGFPDCKHTENFETLINIKCPTCGGDLVMRKTRKGRPFYGCKNWPSCKFASWTKPK
ncbi:MAG: type I DNA topoisomerase, partial [Candidatus Daviesbacteria bacterium]